MSGFAAYQKYIAIKNHFTSDSYDYFKYGGKTQAKVTTFEKRKDKYMFYKLSKKKDIEGFLVSNFISKDVKWVRDFNNSESELVYTEWLKRQQSLSYIFQSDLQNMKDDLNENIIVRDDTLYPYMLELYFQKKICIETLVICDVILNIFQYWNKKIQDKFLWPDLHRTLTKYTPFVKIDKKTYKELLKERFS